MPKKKTIRGMAFVLNNEQRDNRVKAGEYPRCAEYADHFDHFALVGALMTSVT
jgi:hypothetical protein